MNQTSSLSLMWLLTILAATFSCISIFLFIKLLKKVDDNILVISEAFEMYNVQLTKLVKEVEIIKRNVRIVNNEVKETKHRQNKS